MQKDLVKMDLQAQLLAQDLAENRVKMTHQTNSGIYRTFVGVQYDDISNFSFELSIVQLLQSTYMSEEQEVG